MLICLLIFAFFTEDPDFFRTTDDDTSMPRFHDNIGIASSEDVNRERGLCLGNFCWFTVGMLNSFFPNLNFVF